MDESEKKQNAPWSGFVRKGKFKRALTLLNAAIDQSPDDSILYRERAHLHLYLGETHAARADFDVTDRLQSAVFRTPPGRLHSNLGPDAIGITYWMEGHRDLALAFWRYTTRSLANNRVGYAPQGGGIESGLLLWFGAVHERLEADVRLVHSLYETRLASAHWSHNLRGWPGPLVHFFRQQIDERQLLNAAREEKSQLCEAHFAIGIRARERRRYAACWKHLAQAAPRKGPQELYEYYNVLPYFLARFELESAAR